MQKSLQRLPMVLTVADNFVLNFAVSILVDKVVLPLTVLLNSDHQKKKLLHPKSIPTSQCYNCTLIFNNFEMFRMKIFELKRQKGGVNA